MLKKLTSLTLAAIMILAIANTVYGTAFTGNVGNEATFETMQEAHENAPKALVEYPEYQSMTFVGHPVLDDYPEDTTFVYRSANYYGGRAAGRWNTCLLVFTEEKFASKDDAYAYLKKIGTIDIIDESIGSVILVTPIGDAFGAADAAAYYKLQTAMTGQKFSVTQADGSRVSYAEGEYFGSFGFFYYIGVDGGATFFNNYIATTYNYATRLAGVLLVGGTIAKISQPSTFIPMFLSGAPEEAIEKYKAANDVNAMEGGGGLVSYYNQAQPVKRVTITESAQADMKALVNQAYYGLFTKAVRVPVHPNGLSSRGTEYSGTAFDQAPYSLWPRTAIIGDKTAGGIVMISMQGLDTFKDITTEQGNYINTWYEYLPEEVLDGSAPDGTVPLILAVHGGGDDPRIYVDGMGFLPLAERDRFAMVAPIHDGNSTGGQYAALVEYMLDKYPALDASRVYAVGYSMGGGASYKAGYYKPELYAAIAPIAGTNMEPTEEQIKNFEKYELPIFLSTSSYDVRRLAYECGPINENLANQVKRWAGFNGATVPEMDFDKYPISGFEGDAWRVETLNNEVQSHTWYLNNDDGVPMVALNYVWDLIHQLYPAWGEISWEYCRQFSRNQETGEIIYNPYR